MRQSHADSFMEALCNVIVGVAISMTANAIFIPLATGHPVTLAENGALAAIYTVISLARSYAIRRAFNGRTIWQAIKGAS